MNAKVGFGEVVPANELYTIKRVWLKTDGSGKFWINDAGRSIPYNFRCKNCNENEVSIEVEKNPFNFSSSDKYKTHFDMDEIVKRGGMGGFCKFIKCKTCDTLYYLGLGYTEPNNGRDVFILHCIWELELS